MSTVIQLGNQSFTYNNTDSDHERRKLYFKGRPEAQLDPLEKAILTALGVDKAMEKSLAPYLADFFKLLPSCSSDTSLLLSKQCELPHFVLWSILFANKDRIQNRIANRPSGAPSNLNVAGIQGLLAEIRSGMPANMPGAVPGPAPAEEQLPPPSAPAAAAPALEQPQSGAVVVPLPAPNAAINRLFTLIFPEQEPAQEPAPAQGQIAAHDQAIQRLFTLIINDPDN
jgi:hypothetical protein